MRVSEVVYHASDQAALTANYIRLKMTLLNQGVEMKAKTFEGESKYLDKSAWLMQNEYEQVEADELSVEAFNLEVPTHSLSVNGRMFDIPLTGSNTTRTYTFRL